MSLGLIIAIIVVAFVILNIRKAAAKRRAVGLIADQISRSLGAQQAGSSSPGGVDLQASVVDAVQQALAGSGLGGATTTISTRVTTSSGADTSLADDAAAKLAVAEVLSISSLSGTRVAALELDAIGSPKRRATLDVVDDIELTRGDRIYVEVDPADPARVTLARSLGDGFKLPAGMNRLDAVVLGPAIMVQGATGKAVVRSAEQVPLANPALGTTGASKWRLDLEVSPDSGFPYQADLTITLSSAEKVERICHRGAEVPVRYDPGDPKTLTIDSRAMGYPDPYRALTGIAGSGLGSGGKIAQIAAVRVQQGISLSNAKEMVERMNAGLAVAPVVQTSTTIDWNSLAGMSKIEQIKVVRERTGLDLKDAKDLVETMGGLGPAGVDRTAQMVAMLSGRRKH